MIPLLNFVKIALGAIASHHGCTYADLGTKTWC
jgi:hypothetical protein